MPAFLAITSTIVLGLACMAFGIFCAWRPGAAADALVMGEAARPSPVFLRVCGAILVLGGIGIVWIGVDGLVGRF
jgi:hypothetical protein